ncbi:MAG: hypothetical protein IJV00_00805 [Clostridia bacterium]|nr:hypothetical protein [Clostridia bacterium]
MQKLTKEDVFSYELCFTAEEYYETAKWVAAELESFELKPDASLSLIEIYEELLAEARVFDFEAFLIEGKAISDMAPEKPSGISERFILGLDLLERRETLEALLALDVYYDRLDKSDVRIMTECFEEFAELKYKPSVKVCGSAYSGTLFDIYRRSRSGQSD